VIAARASCDTQRSLDAKYDRIVRCVPFILLPSLVLGGCMGALSSKGPEKLTVEPAQYQRAFDAATTVIRSMGFKIAMVDRSNGIIESEPRHAGGALEPWRIDNSGPVDAAGNTIMSRRRRVRVEFLPESAPLESVRADATLTGAAIPGSTRSDDRFDVQTATGPIDMAVWVYIDRSFIEGSKPDPYTGGFASAWTNRMNQKPIDAQDDSIRDNPLWTPMGRDDAFERTIAAKVADELKVTVATEGTSASENSSGAATAAPKEAAPSRPKARPSPIGTDLAPSD